MSLTVVEQLKKAFPEHAQKWAEQEKQREKLRAEIRVEVARCISNLADAVQMSYPTIDLEQAQKHLFKALAISRELDGPEAA